MNSSQPAKIVTKLKVEKFQFMPLRGQYELIRTLNVDYEKVKQVVELYSKKQSIEKFYKYVIQLGKDPFVLHCVDAHLFD